MVSLHRGRFVVVHRCSSFLIDPKNFSQWANFYQKLPFLAIFGAVQPHFKSYNGEIWHAGVVLGLTPQAKLCKNDLRGYTHLGEIYTKNYHLWRFFGP